MTSPHRFIVLDSWRGIAACFVAMLHFGGNSHIAQLSLMKHSWLFVDFFFVLSGFIIAANYQKRFLEGRISIVSFMLLRFGRLYPLHIAMLLPLVLRKVIQATVPSLDSMAANPAFQSAFDSPGSIVAHVFMVHGFGFTSHASWNGPSWSISNEFFAYLIFGGILIVLRKRPWLAFLVAFVFGPSMIALLGDNFYVVDFRIFRCLVGFSAGVVTWNIYRIKKVSPNTTVEVLTMCLAFGFIWLSGRLNLAILGLLAPIVFSLVVFIFAFEKGGMSKFLNMRAFQILGILSYSIYMTHTLVTHAIFDVAKVVGALTGRTIYIATDTVRYINLESWFSDLGQVAYLLIVIGFSYLTFRFIESPSRLWFRQLATSLHGNPQEIPSIEAKGPATSSKEN